MCGSWLFFFFGRLLLGDTYRWLASSRGCSVSLPEGRFEITLIFVLFDNFLEGEPALLHVDFVLEFIVLADAEALFEPYLTFLPEASDIFIDRNGGAADEIVLVILFLEHVHTEGHLAVLVVVRNVKVKGRLRNGHHPLIFDGLVVGIDSQFGLVELLLC